MKYAPKISVIVPVYKVEKVLSRCINSILSQVYTNFEVLLIDDGSPDKSGQICDDYAKLDTRIRVFHQSNKGVSAARNKGLKEAIGEYVLFVDSDDCFNGEWLKMLEPYMGKYDMCFWGAKILSEKDQEKLVGEYLPIQKDTEHDASLADIIYSLFKIGLLGYMWSMCIRKNIITQNGILFDENIAIHEDAIFCYACLKHAKKLYVFAERPYNYYLNDLHSGSSLSSKMPSYYSAVALRRVRMMEDLLCYVNMDDVRSTEIISLLKYWSYARYIDHAYHSSNRKDNLLKVMEEMGTFLDFKPQSIKELIFKLIIRTKSPYLLILCKKILRIFG